MNSQSNRSLVRDGGDLDVWALLDVVRRRFGLVALVTLGIVGIVAVVVAGMPPRYSSEAQILIEDAESRFTRPDRATGDAAAADQAAVLSEVQVLLSRDLAADVSQQVGLAGHDEFSGKGRKQSLPLRILSLVGLDGGRVPPTDERVIEHYYDRLSVFQVENSRVISVRFTAEEAELAARVANALADAYIGANRQARFSSDSDAAEWLEGEIKTLRVKVAEAEQAVEAYRAESGLWQGGRDATLYEQQLSENNTQLIAARGQESEARARAALVRRLVKEPGGLDAAAEVLNSRLIQRLRELQAAQSRDIAELTATLLPGHPRMQQLRAEQADLERRIRDEIGKIAQGLENEADIAAARVSELQSQLDGLKSEATAAKAAEVKLRALERESAAQRDLLESFLRRYREASARGDLQSQPANARIISRATTAASPSFPKMVPILALTGVAATLLGLLAAFVVEFLAPAAKASPGTLVPPGGRRREPVAETAISDKPQLEALLSDRLSRDGSGGASRDGGGLSKAEPTSTALAIRQVAQRIGLLCAGRGHRRLLVLDPDADAGRDKLVLDLARHLSDLGRRTVLVDLTGTDRLGKLAGLPPHAGVAELLAGRAGLAEVLAEAGDGGSGLVAAGLTPLPEPVPADRLNRVLDALAGRYDLVLVMAGGAGDLATALAAAADLTLLNVPAEALNGKELNARIGRLRAAGVGQAAVISASADHVHLYEAINVRNRSRKVA